MALMSPLRYRAHLMWNALPWKKEEVIREVAEVHAADLPRRVEVSWERDGEMIVGEIFLDSEKIMTQADSAKEFVEMVNDAIYTACNIPNLYVPMLGGFDRIHPTPEEFAKLDNASVKKSSPRFAQEKEIVAA
jgi:hypothetical protein